MNYKLFGTDGIRGKYPEDFSSTFSNAVGKAIASVFSLSPEPTTIVIGRDTRASGEELEQAVAQGIHSMGASTVHVGVVPSGCISYLASKLPFAAGIMISASHNPSCFNGIKVFAANGFKSSAEYESKMAHLVHQNHFVPSAELGCATKKPNLASDFVFYLQSLLPATPTHKKVAVDCANGAAYLMAKQVFAFEKNFVYLFSQPNGHNINDGCGATSLSALSNYVVQNKCDFGIAFDGDADRLQAVDEQGRCVDGDMLLFAFAKFLQQKQLLVPSAIACTTLSNCGLSASLERLGIHAFTVGVGDKEVSNAMLQSNLVLGGEQSGHILFSKHLNTGDGLLSSCMLLNLVNDDLPFSSLFEGFEAFPQVQINVAVLPHQKTALLLHPKIKELIAETETLLCAHGRVLVRASGTENVIRVLVEGKDYEQICFCAKTIARAIETLSLQ